MKKVARKENLFGDGKNIQPTAQALENSRQSRDIILPRFNHSELKFGSDWKTLIYKCDDIIRENVMSSNMERAIATLQSLDLDCSMSSDAYPSKWRFLSVNNPLGQKSSLPNVKAIF